MLNIENLSVQYGKRTGLHPANLALGSGEFVGLIGPNGAGKTSLLRALAGLINADGQVQWQDKDLTRMGRRARAKAVAYLEQSPASHWPLRVRDLVALGRLPHRRFGEAPTALDDEAVEIALEQTDTSSLSERLMDELSGGEHARVQLARALSVRAPVLLVDEPIALLDPYHQLHIMAVLSEYANNGSLVIAVLHDLTLAARFCRRTVLLHEGRVAGDGPPSEVLTKHALQTIYQIDPIISTHQNEPMIVPWNRLN